MDKFFMVFTGFMEGVLSFQMIVLYKELKRALPVWGYALIVVATIGGLIVGTRIVK